MYIKNYASYRSVNAHVDDIFENVWHHNVKINGRAQGFTACYRNKATGNLCYICTDMIPESYGNMLIRSMAHEKDYTGGHNEYAKTWYDMKSIMQLVTGGI